jgi:ubiquinone/menaquinone biosynthesis C-methylase UbiE
MYAFHEAPHARHDKILAEAYRLLQNGGGLALLDISAECHPSKTMLVSEPYVLEYQRNINRQLKSPLKGFTQARFKDLFPG